MKKTLEFFDLEDCELFEIETEYDFSIGEMVHFELTEKERRYLKDYLKTNDVDDIENLKFLNYLTTQNSEFEGIITQKWVSISRNQIRYTVKNRN